MSYEHPTKNVAVACCFSSATASLFLEHLVSYLLSRLLSISACYGTLLNETIYA